MQYQRDFRGFRQPRFRLGRPPPSRYYPGPPPHWMIGPWSVSAPPPQSYPFPPWTWGAPRPMGNINQFIHHHGTQNLGQSFNQSPFQQGTEYASVNTPPLNCNSQKDAENKAYAVFFKAAKLSTQSVHTLSQNSILNKQTYQILEIMDQFKGVVTNFQYLIRLLRQQEHYPEGSHDKVVKLLMVFVRLCRGLKLAEVQRQDKNSPSVEMERILTYFRNLFNKTLQNVTNQSYPIAVTHLRILHSLKLECSEIGLQVEPLDDVHQVLAELEMQRIKEEYAKSVEEMQSTQTDAVHTPPNKSMEADTSKMDDNSLPINIWGMCDDESAHASEHEHDKTPPEISPCNKDLQIEIEMSPQLSENVDSESHNYAEQFTQIRNQLIQEEFKDISSSERCTHPLKIMRKLLHIFSKSRRVDNQHHNDGEYIQILLEEAEFSNNTGRKTILWTLCGILENLTSTLPFSWIEGEMLGIFVENMEISKCNIKWDTIELLALRNRLSNHLDADFLHPIDSFLRRLTVQKYRMVCSSSVKLDMSDFYPGNILALQKARKAVLIKIPKVINDFVVSCKRELDKDFYSPVNKRANRPEIECLGFVVRPPPEVLTVSDDSGDDN